MLNAKEEDPCGTFERESIERHVKFKDKSGMVTYKESKVDGMTVATNKGTLGPWKLSKKKKILKIKFATGWISYSITECTKEKLVLKKL